MVLIMSSDKRTEVNLDIIQSAVTALQKELDRVSSLREEEDSEQDSQEDSQAFYNPAPPPLPPPDTCMDMFPEASLDVDCLDPSSDLQTLPLDLPLEHFKQMVMDATEDVQEHMEAVETAKQARFAAHRAYQVI